MTVDLIGPANAPNAVTVRPGDTRVFGASDTFFKDCTTPGTGTKVQAGYMNGLLAQVRNLIRGNGNTGAPAPVVTEDNTDDSMMLKAVQYLIQRGQPIYAVDTSTTIGVVTVALSPAAVEYKAGMKLRIKMANNCVGPNVINANTLGNKSIVKTPGSVALVGGEWQAGDIVELSYDGTNFQGSGLGQRAPLTAAVDIYVNSSTGSDTALDGSAATVSGQHGPFATLQKAYNIVGQFAPGTFGATIHLSGNTHDQGTSIAQPVNWAHCNVSIVGAGAGSTLITGHAAGGGVIGPPPTGVIYTYSSLSVSYTGTGSNSPCIAGNGQTVINGVQFNGASGTNNGFVSGCVIQTSVTINGNCGGTLFAGNGQVGISFLTCTVNGGGSAWSFGVFAGANAQGSVTVNGTVTFSGTGSMTGKRYNAAVLSYVNSGGGGANFFPGNVAGTLDASSWYY